MRIDIQLEDGEVAAILRARGAPDGLPSMVANGELRTWLEENAIGHVKRAVEHLSKDDEIATLKAELRKVNEALGRTEAKLGATYRDRNAIVAELTANIIQLEEVQAALDEIRVAAQPILVEIGKTVFTRLPRETLRLSIPLPILDELKRAIEGGDGDEDDQDGEEW